MENTTENRPYVGVGVIVVKEGKILLGKRKNAHGAGGWQFPGGHLEFNESVEDCARREVLEETGISIKNISTGPYTNDIFAPENKHYITLYMIAQYNSGTVEVKEPHKCEIWDWFEPARFPEPLFLPIQNLLKQGFDFNNELRPSSCRNISGTSSPV
ncbi:MAG: NUDIX domain-containing protein [bacterium]|nr:NUDIX domain-containing protein [bacterium]